MALEGPSRRIVVAPQEMPSEAPSVPAPAPVREREPVPA